MRLKVVVLLAAVFFASYSFATGLPVNQIVAFGDSLTDTGNVYLASGGTLPPSPPYYNGRYSNGPIWIDQFSSLMGLTDPTPSSAGGTNYSFAGARTGTGGSVPTMLQQVEMYLNATSDQASASALYSFWGGANDILNGQSPTTAANNIEAQIQALALAGGKYFLWFNLPPLGDTPDGSSEAGLANALSNQFNQQWSTDLSTLRSEGIDVIGVNIDALFTQIVSDPGMYGFTNVTDACLNTNTDAVCSSPGSYLFWDGLHPTTYADSFVANLAYQDAVPEPASFALLAFGATALLALKRKRS